MLGSVQDWFVEKTDAVVALSGGVDSALVAYAAYSVLGSSALAVTADYSTLATEELDSARNVAAQIGIEHHIIQYNELEDTQFTKNDSDRCYHCRSQLGDHLRSLASRLNYTTIVDGTNLDDTGDYRPGIGALHERDIQSPLLEMNISKRQIRDMARDAGLSVHDRPSNSCLASRIPWGERITAQRLARIEMGERYIRHHIPLGSLRVRDVSGGARIEVESEMIPQLQRSMPHVQAALLQLGFAHVEIEPQGYRTGGANL